LKYGGRVRYVEPIDSLVTRRSSIVACATSATTIIDPQALTKTLGTLESSGSREAVARVKVAQAMADVDLAQKQDEKDTSRNDPLRLRLKDAVDQRRRNVDPAAEINIRMEKISELTSDIVDVALAWSEVNDVRLSNLLDDANTLEPVLTEARLALKIREDDFASSGILYRAGQEFVTAAARELDRIAGTVDTAMTLRGRVEQPCLTAGTVDDSLRITIERPTSSMALLAELSFDRGASQVTVLRRIESSEGWEGRMFWPLDATSAAVRVRLPGSKRWSSVSGRVTNRAPAGVVVAQARAAVRKIDKKLKDAKFRAVGGDNIKTIWIR
jgi:hypothetical protein